jgi:hypothetical protein
MNIYYGLFKGIRYMLSICPFCGHFLSKSLADGIASCTNCCRIFDSSPMNRLLSAGWLCRKKHYDDVEDLVREGFTTEEAELVVEFIVDNQYDPQEFAEELKRMGVSNVYTVAC